jgi:hypothetical protein
MAVTVTLDAAKQASYVFAADPAWAPRVALWQRPATSRFANFCGRRERYGMS